MINRILMELYDDYIENGNEDKLKKFAEKTFNDADAKNMFIGATLILFSRCNGFKPRYDANREYLLSIVSSVKKDINGINSLKFYLEKKNTAKGIVKYFHKLTSEEAYIKSANIVIDYLEHFKPDFIKEIEKF